MDLVDILKNVGFETLEAADAEEAIRALEMNPSIGIILSDINMPGELDGIGLARLIRAQYPEKRVALVSANNPAHLGIPSSVPFVRKPFEVGDIEQVVEELTGQATCIAGNLFQPGAVHFETLPGIQAAGEADSVSPFRALAARSR